MKKKAVILILLILIIGATLGFLYFKNRKVQNELTLFGNIEIRQVDLSFQVSGKIEKMLKEEGDTVKAGELIAIIDDKDYVSNLEKAKADVEKTLAIKDDAESKFKRQAPLVEDNTISKQDYDTLLNTKKIDNPQPTVYTISGLNNMQFKQVSHSEAKNIAANQNIFETTHPNIDGLELDNQIIVFARSLDKLKIAKKQELLDFIKENKGYPFRMSCY